MPRFNFNKIYAPVFTTNSRTIDIWGGRGRGGSHFGTDYFLFLITQPHYFRGYFVRQAFADIRDSLFRDFKDRIEENKSVDINDFHIQDNEMRILHKPTGNLIMSKGTQKDGTRTAKMKSLAGATHVLLEEADELKEEDYDQLDLSLRTTKSDRIQVLRVFNPPSKNHWIWRDYTLIDSDIEGYFKAVPKTTSDIISIFSTYHHNIRNIQESTITKLESFKESNSDYYYNIVLGLISEGSKGRIYKGWQSITDEYFTKLEYPSIYCLDFGYSQDPNALAEIKSHGQHIYGRELLYEPGLDNIALAKKLIDLGISVKDMIVADYGGGGDLRIAELRRGWSGIEGYPQLNQGFTIYPTIKAEVASSVNIVKSYMVHWTESSSNAWLEYQEYKWALDRNKNPTDTPVDKSNHLMDDLRYYCLCKGRLF
jgi:phage terminase large subunit